MNTEGENMIGASASIGMSCAGNHLLSHPLLDGPSSVRDAIGRFAQNHQGLNPKRNEFIAMFSQLGNVPEEIESWINTAETAGIVKYDRNTDVLSESNWEEKYKDGDSGECYE